MVRGSAIVALAACLAPAVAAAAQTERVPLRAHCDAADGDKAYAEWREWSRKNLPISADGIDFSRAVKAGAESPATVERVLHLGLAACDPIAAMVIANIKLRALLPELEDLLVNANVLGGPSWVDRFAPLGVEVVRAANAVDPATDYSRHLVPLFSAPQREVRITAAMIARHFHKDRVREGLLKTVATDSSYLVRFHAAESLLALGNVVPREVHDHSDLFALLKGSGPDLFPSTSPDVASVWSRPRGRAPAPRR